MNDAQDQDDLFVLIVVPPERQRPRHVHNVHSNLNFAPTVLDAFGEVETLLWHFFVGPGVYVRRGSPKLHRGIMVLLSAHLLFRNC